MHARQGRQHNAAIEECSMSAINVLVQRDAAFMMCDGLSYIDGVPLELNLNKAHLLKGMRAALSATGPAELGRFIAEHVEREFTSFDDLAANGSDRIKQLFREYVDTYRNGDAVSSLSLIGWHEKVNRPAAYGIDLETKGAKADWVIGSARIISTRTDLESFQN